MTLRKPGHNPAVLILFTLLAPAQVSEAAPLTKEAIASRLTKARAFPPMAFTAKVHVKVSGGSISHADSGVLTFSPPNCFRMELKVSATTQMGCGDTLWTISRGSVSRSITAPGEGMFGSLDPVKFLKEKAFEFQEKDGGKFVEISFTIGEKEKPMNLKVLLDTGAWLSRRTTVSHPHGPPIEVGYSYMKFGGQDVFKEVNTVLGSNGFMRMSFGEYRKSPRLSKSHFRGF